jgi:hypothetical protein
MKLAGGPTDPRTCPEYTAWNVVDDLALRIAEPYGRIQPLMVMHSITDSTAIRLSVSGFAKRSGRTEGFWGFCLVSIFEGPERFGAGETAPVRMVAPISE